MAVSMEPSSANSPQPVPANFFRSMGLLAIALSIVFLTLFAFNLRSRLYFQGPDWGFLLWMSVYCAITGAGLLRFRKWAVLLSFIPAMAYAAILVVSSKTEAKHYSDLVLLFNFAICGLLFVVPAKMSRHWNALRW